MANYYAHYYKFLNTGVSKTQVQAKEFVTYNILLYIIVIITI